MEACACVLGHRHRHNCVLCRHGCDAQEASRRGARAASARCAFGGLWLRFR